MTFLTLAPATSSSYPQTQSQRTPVFEAGDATSTDEARPALQRRSSSVSSTGFKILKLGPVHWGEHLDEEQTSDFVDMSSQ